MWKTFPLFLGWTFQASNAEIHCDDRGWQRQTVKPHANTSSLQAFQRFHQRVFVLPIIFSLRAGSKNASLSCPFIAQRAFAFDSHWAFFFWLRPPGSIHGLTEGVPMIALGKASLNCPKTMVKRMQEQRRRQD